MEYLASVRRHSIIGSRAGPRDRIRRDYRRPGDMTGASAAGAKHPRSGSPTMTVAGVGSHDLWAGPRRPYRACLPGYFPFVMAMSIIPTGFWRHVRQHWPLTYEPALWSVVFPLGMYSVATLTFGKVARLAFMEPLSRLMLWVAVAAWAVVAAAFVARILHERVSWW
jgi:hypothetical protein